MLQWTFRLFISFVLLFPLTLSAAENLNAEHLKIDFLAPKSFPSSGETLIGVRFRPDPHWHVYWKNPGDSGAAPKFRIDFTNAKAGEILWPTPTRLPVAHLTNLGYEGEVVYLFQVKTSGQTPVRISAGLEWLVCQEECLPGFGELSLERPATGASAVFDDSVRKKLEEFSQRLSKPGSESPFTLKISETDSSLQVSVASTEPLPVNIELFPLEPEYVSPAQPIVNRSEASADFVFKTSAASTKPAHLGFLFVADGKAFEFPSVEFPSSVSIASMPDENSPTVWLLILSALLGGVLLNLMPCVFPVLSIKAMGLLKSTDRAQRHRDGLMYTLGALTTFAALGAGFLILRQMGAAMGWGFQLQSPLVVFSLAILFWLMALNFLGTFELGTSVMNVSGNIQWRSSFGTGVLAVFVAAPCTGPFMGTALGATATLPGWQAMMIFLALGFGLALPYLLFAYVDSLAKRLPRPGAWMETLKEFLAFPLFATVIWLIWVLGQQKGTHGWSWTALALLGVSFAIWLGQRKKAYWFKIAWILGVVVIAFTGMKLHQARAPQSVSEIASAWSSYSDAKLQEAITNRQSVFVDFTAAWCITCQVNKKAVLETEAGDEIFAKAGIVRLRADWTNQDKEITAALSRLGRNSVPVYAFYAKGAKTPVLLPQILTLNMIRELTTNTEEK